MVHRVLLGFLEGVECERGLEGTRSEGSGRVWEVEASGELALKLVAFKSSRSSRKD